MCFEPFDPFSRFCIVSFRCVAFEDFVFSCMIYCFFSLQNYDKTKQLSMLSS